MSRYVNGNIGKIHFRRKQEAKMQKVVLETLVFSSALFHRNYGHSACLLKTKRRIPSR